jgi:ubiquinone/menaquinone biosynthesis C-methylase UbiE
MNLWDEAYKHRKTPWDTGKPSMHLVNNMKLFNTEKTLDICSGPGNDAVFLAKHGYVTGIDVSITAIRNAKKKAAKNNMHVDFVLGNILELPFKNNSFTFVNDRGCFHHVRPENGKRFSEELLRVMKKMARYLMQGFCKREKYIVGPKKLSENEIRDTFKEMKIVKLYEDRMDETFDYKNAYALVAEK